jgi:hypothetical protein
MKIVDDRWRDEEGRRLVLRGVNLGGDSKVPVHPDGYTGLKEGFYDWRKVSFVGRPFPLEEADEHFSRLKRWGMDFLRFLVTWEAVEHEGPGIYDEEYLEYLERIVAKAQKHGMRFFVDPHQDAWSRWTGGDGAPAWTLEAVGFEPSRLHASGAALLHQEMGETYPRKMIWFSNYDRLACATMWTVFFAGDRYAPGIGPIGFEGRSLQEFLQGRYIAAMSQVARRLARFSCVVGFGSLNEPSLGWIGRADMRKLGSMVSMGTTPSPWEAVLAGSGYAVDAAVIGIRLLSQVVVGHERLGVQGLRAWKEGVECLWRRAGVWDEEGGAPILKRPGHFAAASGEDAVEAFLKPFIARFARGIRGSTEAARRFALFVEGVPNADRPSWGGSDPENVVDAQHWYDDLTLVTKTKHRYLAYDARHGRVVMGGKNVRRYFIEALGEIKRWAVERMGAVPSLLGEFGLPFDLKGGRAYRTGRYRAHEEALSAYYDAVDANLLDSTIWNYSAGNTHRRGDLWNREDLSIFCRDDYEAGRTETGDPADSGGRALRGFVRPYARAVAGEILQMRFDARRGVFMLRYAPDQTVSAPTEIFVPELQFPRGFAIETEGCEAEVLRGLVLLRPRPGAAEARLVLRRLAVGRSAG